ncbi:hypothetical protein BN2537_15095 [Streptomyces venezuelae]|nr:hypothetical protein BN2537_15095 [Streptomyces venezuelae]
MSHLRQSGTHHRRYDETGDQSPASDFHIRAFHSGLPTSGKEGNPGTPNRPTGVSAWLTFTSLTKVRAV